MADVFDTTTRNGQVSTGVPDFEEPDFTRLIDPVARAWQERKKAKDRQQAATGAQASDWLAVLHAATQDEPTPEDRASWPDSALVERLSGHGGYQIPTGVNATGDGYKVTSEGVWMNHTTAKGELREDLIAYRPFVPVQRMRDDQGGYRYKLAWLTADGRVQEVTSTAAVLGSQMKVSSVFPDVVITSGHARDCSQYIAQCIRYNQEWFTGNARETATAIGWAVQGTEVFVSGPDRPLPVEDAKNTGPWLAGFRERGDLGEWTAAVTSARDRRLVQVMVTAAFAAPLLRVLDEPNFVVDLSGSTSGGKTVSLGLAASVWGDPHDTMVSWKNTRTALEHHLSMLRGVPLFVDESQLARVEDVEDLVYSLTGGKSKGRSRQDGSGLMDSSVWETVMVMTGEQPVTSMTKKGGIVPRVVSMSGQPCRDKAQADLLTKAAKVHHGLAGARFAEYLQGLDEGVLRGRYEVLKTGLGLGAESQTGGRRANSVAVLALANKIASDAGLVPLLGDEVWQWLVEGGGAVTDEEEDRPRTALRDMLGWAALNAEKFFGHAQSGTAPVHGWAGRWDVGRYVAFSPSVVRDLLEKRGYDAQRILLDWRDRGWLRQTGTKTGANVKINGNSVQHIVVTFLEDLTAGVIPGGDEVVDPLREWAASLG